MEILKIIGIYLLAFISAYLCQIIASALSAFILQLINLPISLFLKFILKVNEIAVLKWIDYVKFLSVFISTPIAFIPIIFLFKYFGSVIPVLFFIIIFLFKLWLWRADYIVYKYENNPGDQSGRYTANEVASFILTVVVYFQTAPIIWIWGK